MDKLFIKKRKKFRRRCKLSWC